VLLKTVKGEIPYDQWRSTPPDELEQTSPNTTVFTQSQGRCGERDLWIVAKIWQNKADFDAKYPVTKAIGRSRVASRIPPALRSLDAIQEVHRLPRDFRSS